MATLTCKVTKRRKHGHPRGQPRRIVFRYTETFYGVTKEEMREARA